MSTRSRISFKLLDLMVIFTMVFGSPMSAVYALTDSAESAATGRVGELVKIMPPLPARELVAFPLETLVDEQAPQLRPLNAPALDGAGSADVVYDVGCMEEEAGFGLQCTANDISIANATNIEILDDGCAYPGDTVTFRADFEVKLTAQARHDVGLWFATDGDPNGDGARTGSCSAATPAYAPDPPWLDLDGTLDPYPGTNDPSGVQDTCGDIDDAHNPLYPSVELTVVCVDDDANGKLDLPNCTSWRQPGDNDLCTSPQDAVPGAPSKCKCDTGFNVDIPVPGQIIVDKVTDPAGQSTSFDFTLTGGPDTVNVPFSLTDASDPFESSFLYEGTYAVVETANASYSTSATCDDGSPASAIDLQPGEIVTCTFTNTLLTGTLIVQKNLINDNLGPLTCPDFSYMVDGGTEVPFESDCINSQTVLAGTHTVAEVGVPINGYTTTYNNCTNVNVPAGGSATCTITNDDIAVPMIHVEKSSTATGITAAGQIVPYTFIVTNAGNQTLTGITVTDPNCDLAPVYVSGDNNTDSNLQVGESWTYTCSHTVTQAEIDSNGGGDGDLDNTVTADSNESEEDTDEYFIPITQNASMTVEKSSTTTSLAAPGTVTYDYLVTNTGNTTLTGIVLSDNNDNDDMICEGDTLATGQSMTCQATHTFTQAELDAGGTLDNTVTADSNETGPVTDDLSIPISQNAMIMVVKSSTTTVVNHAGQVVDYSFLVTNEGNITLTGITVTDPMCDAAPLYVSGDLNNDGKLDLDEAWTYTCSHTVTQAEIDAATGLDPQLHNMVTVDSHESDEDTDEYDIPITYDPALSIDKTGTFNSGDDAYADPGELISYTFIVTNTGNITLTGITVTDPKVSPIACPADTLAVGANMTCTATYAVTQADIDAGSVYNMATADSTESEPDTDDETVTLPQNPALMLEKTGAFDAGADGFADVGELITYTFVVTNTGNITLTNVTVTDPLVSNISCPADTLAVGADMTCTGTYAVTQADIDAGFVYNMATADSDESGPDNDDETVTLPQNPALTLDKSGTFDSGADGYANVGELISYEFLVTNTGNVNLTGVAVTDSLGITVTCPKDTLTVGESMTCTASYAVTQADIDAGSVYNLGTADSNETEPVSDPNIETLPQNGMLSIVKTGAWVDGDADGFADAGEVIHYTFAVTNEGNVTLTNVTVTDPKVTVVGGPTTLDVGETDTTTFTGTYTLTQDDVDAGKVDNTATADSDESGPASDDETVNLPQYPALMLVKSGTFDAGANNFADPGELISYEFLVTNTGNITLTGITVNDPKVSPIDCPADTLAVGASITCTGSYAVTQADIDAGSVYNMATADSTESEPDTDDETIILPQNPVISLVKTGTFDAGADGYANVGEVINYTFLVTNEGNVILTNVTVTDPLVSNISCPADTLAVGANMTCTGTYAVTQADIDAGSVYNLATAESNESEPDTDDETVPLPQYPALMLVKSGTFDAGLDGYADPGELISYEFLVTNTGNVTLTGITVTDPKVSLISCPVTTLAVGASMTCTGTYAVTQADIDAGFVYNLATADSDESEPDDGDNNEPLPQNPVISLVKSGTFDAGADGYADVGELISYEFLVTNEGNVTLTGITVTDPKVSPINCPADTLAVGTSMTCTGAYAVTQADIDAGSVYNLATADSKESPPDDGNNTEPLPQDPKLSIDKTGVFDAGLDGFADPGELITYTFVVTNTGNVTLHNVTVTDPLAGLSAITCDATTIPVGGFITCTATYAVTQADIDTGFVYNLATADSDESGPDDDNETITLPQNPLLSITKVATETSYDEVSDVLNYQITATNIGNVTLAAVTVTDPLVSDLNCTPANGSALAPGEVMTCTATHTVTQADIDAGHWANAACVDDGELGAPEVCNDEDVPADQNPAISIVKSLASYDDNDLSGDISNGDGLWYQFLVTNTGNVTLDPISVTDNTFAMAVTCPVTVLSPNDFTTCTADVTHTVTLAEANAGEVFNEATASGTDPNGTPTTATDDLTTPVVQHPAISIVKSLASYDDNDLSGDISNGDGLWYQFLVTNTGDVTLDPVSVTDDTFAIAVTCSDAALDPGDAVTCMGDTAHSITLAEANAGEVFNEATASGTDPNGVPTTDTDDLTTPVVQHPAIAIVKTTNDMDGGNFLVGNSITWKYVVKNIGDVTLSNVKVADDIIGDVCTVTSLDPGVSTTCTKTGTAALGEYENIGTATADDPKGNDITASDDSSYFGADPEIDVEKLVSINGGVTWIDADSATGPYLNTGTAPQFKFVVTNTGNVDLSSVTVTDSDFTLPAGCIASTLVVGASDDCTITGAWAAGQHNNKATASGSFTDDNSATETDTDTDDANYFGADPKIDLTKTGAWVDGNANGYADAGETVNYSFVVKNTGNVPLSSVTVTDPKVSSISCPKTTLVVNESMTCTGSYTLTLADIYTGKVDNTATASGSFTDDNNNTRTVTDPASATVTLPLAPTGQILPTQTSCQQFRDGTYQTMQQYYPPNGYVYYMLKGRLINNVNPGVFFYYSKVTLAGGTFSIDIMQGNDKSWPKIPTQVGDNIVLWDATCSKVQDLTAAYDPATGKATISGSVPAGVYYISVKWQPSATYNMTTFSGLVGYAPTGKPIVTYSFQAYLQDSNYTGPIASSGANQILASKK